MTDKPLTLEEIDAWAIRIERTIHPPLVGKFKRICAAARAHMQWQDEALCTCPLHGSVGQTYPSAIEDHVMRNSPPVLNIGDAPKGMVLNEYGDNHEVDFTIGDAQEREDKMDGGE